MSYLGRVTNKPSDIRVFDVTSSTSATHTLTWTAPNEQSLIVTINGVKQHEDAYSVSGTTLTLTDALVATDKLEVIGINDIGTTITPAQNSITNDMVSSTAAIAQSKLATLAIDTSEIADDAVTADKLANSINTEIAANTAKVTNATHTGDVTGATALTIAVDAVDIAMLSATGTASSSTFLRGDNAWASAAAGLNSVQTFTASGTWTKPAGITKVIMEVQGGGGRGGNGDGSYNGGGAGGGGYARKFLDVSSISTSTITIGAGATSPSTDGGDTSWADGTNTITGNGGEAGAGAAGGSGIHGHGMPGGTGVGGDINITGQGGSGIAENEMGGGSSFLGFGNNHTGAINVSSYEGVAGLGYGAGGSGCTASSGTGGNGTDGVIIVWEYK